VLRAVRRLGAVFGDTVLPSSPFFSGCVMQSWVTKWWRPRRSGARRPAHTVQPAVERLDERCVPAHAGFLKVNLVSDQAGHAAIVDPNLVNSWGLALSGGALWASNNGTSTSTLYSGGVNGSSFMKDGLEVKVPGGSPTGVVFNTTHDFLVSSGAGSGTALFLFASENGTITGWAPAVPPPSPSTMAQTAVSMPGAVFKGLALGSAGGQNFLYVADFHDNKVLVFDHAFHQTTLVGSFTDPRLPKGFAPFNVADLNGSLYVTYAKQKKGAHDDKAGPGNGFVDVFDTSGNFQRRLTSHGHLNSPWGMALAPGNFGKFSGDLLVGNFGDGRINAFDPTTGKFRGQVSDKHRQPITIDGLWGLAFGNGTTVGATNQLFFAAGPNKETHGLLGSITPSA
jgi:uncharacterized protein (TIGR03118 family)